LPRDQLDYHIPLVLVAFERELGDPGAAQRTDVADDKAAAHGLQSWQQGHDLREVVRELGRLNVMRDARWRWVSACSVAIEESAAQYFRLRRTEAAGHLSDLEKALDAVRELERQRAELWREIAHDLGISPSRARPEVGFTRWARVCAMAPRWATCAGEQPPVATGPPYKAWVSSPPGAGWRAGPLRTLPCRAQHALPPGSSTPKPSSPGPKKSPAAVVLGLQTVGHLSASRVAAAPPRSWPPVVNHGALPRNESKEMTVSTRPIEALHDIHAATQDVLKGSREMAARAEPEIKTVIQRLTDMHQRHASEQGAELVRLRDAGKDDSSLQGTVNKVVVVLRDWLSNLDEDALPAVRKGEESLRDEYNKALDDLQVRESPSVLALLKTQYDSIGSEIARLPNG
jgi:uncharacterized protein (TIGR02284 family)